MEYRNLGHSGLEVSLVGLGCNNFGRRCDAEQTARIVNRAIELGITCLDTSDSYGPRGLSEEYLGQALKAGVGRAAAVDRHLMGDSQLPSPIMPTDRPIA